jgi:hypothetical protein
MRVTKLRIDGQVFFLSQDVDVPALQQQILAAVRVEAAFVTFRPVGRGVVSALVTQHLPVSFEVEEVHDEGVPLSAADQPPADLGEYFQDLAAW